MFAALLGRPEVIRLLLDHGAELEAKSDVSPICGVVGPGAGGCDQLGESHDLSPPPHVCWRADPREADEATTVAVAGLHLNTQDEETALAMAVADEKVDAVRYLLERGADVETRNEVSPAGTLARRLSTTAQRPIGCRASLPGSGARVCMCWRGGMLRDSGAATAR